MISTITYLF